MSKVFREAPAQTDVDGLVQFVRSRAPKTFAILGSIGQNRLISRFRDGALGDEILPIEVDEQGSVQSSKPELTEATNQLFDSLDVYVPDNFLQNQKGFLAHVFRGGDKHQFRYKIGPHICMPFLVKTPVSNRGAFGTVTKCIVHKGHFSPDIVS